ncbi:MAG: hypothetical protein RBU45_19680 [Myxococcota bacterium]|jgi:DNA polymerase III sliding clamp (beta) subunit (PCNA family)|nr:hypothetical protein [Myxococcota bacterium]
MNQADVCPVTGERPDRVQETLDLIVQKFIAGDVASALAKASFPACDVPLSRWSLNNRFLAALAGTIDGRGFHQWKEVKRSVKKGAKAFFILAPTIVPDHRAEPGDNGDRPMKLVGFRAVPVFRVEDTEGEPLDYQQIQVPEHPLIDVAKAWGLRIQAVPANGIFYGSYCPGKSQILLATPDEQTFFHELAHAADEKVNGPLQGGQRPDQEIVAQLAAEVLAQMVGRQMGNPGYSYLRISGYAREWFPKVDEQEAIRKACHQVLRRTCQVIEAILKAAHEHKEDHPCPTPDPPSPSGPALPALPAEEPAPCAPAPSTGITTAPPVAAPAPAVPSTSPACAPAVEAPASIVTSPSSIPPISSTEPSTPTSGISPPCESIDRKITVNGLQLKQLLAALKPHVEAPWPNIRVFGEEGRLGIEAIGIKTQVAAKVHLPGSGVAGFDLHLPLRDLAGVVQAVKKKEKVILGLADDGQGLQVELEAISTRLNPISNPEEAPVYPGMIGEIERIATLALDTTAIDYTLPAMSTDKARPGITVLHFEPETCEKPAFVVSTDGHRLHEADMPGACVTKSFSLAAAAAELIHKLAKLLGGASADVVAGSTGPLEVRGQRWEVRSTAEEQPFPDFRRVLPRAEWLPTSVTIPLETFRSTLRAMKKIPAVTVNVNGSIDLTWTDPASGCTGKASIPQLGHDGPDVVGAFNPRYLADAFEMASTRGIWLFPALEKDTEGKPLSDGVLGPTLFRSQAGDRRAVLMPVRI